jgi:hypothetical protein
MTSWGVTIRGTDSTSESKCWRCLEASVPDEDELGLCDWCVASLRGES